MQEPIEKLLDTVDWQQLPESDSADLHATHSGTLKIGNQSLLVYQLSDGRRVIDEGSMVEFFKALAG